MLCDETFIEEALKQNKSRTKRLLNYWKLYEKTAKITDTFLKTAISSGEYVNVNTIVFGGKDVGKSQFRHDLLSGY